MKNIAILFLAFIISILATQAQTLERQIIGATGGASNIDSGRVLLFNVGEPVTSTGISGTFALTQGFEQSDSLKPDSVIGIVRYDIFSNINIYPNPGREIVFLKMESSRSLPLIIAMYDENGKEVVQLNVELRGGQSHTEELTTSDLSFGTYFFHFTDAKNGSTHVAKWIRY
jgi:hypothetical protein